MKKSVIAILVVSAVLVVSSVVAFGLGAAWLWNQNDPGRKARDCQQAYSTALGAVPEVVSVEPSCRYQLEGSFITVTVRLRAADSAQATAGVEAVLRALAADPRIDSAWSLPKDFRLADGTAIDDPLGAYGFYGDNPAVYDARDYFNIHPK